MQEKPLGTAQRRFPRCRSAGPVLYLGCGFFRGEGAELKKVRITVKRIARYDDLIATYENPIEHACGMELGQTFTANGWEKPEGFCSSAWDTLSPFVLALAHGGENFYDGWMKDPKSAMLSCNDGFRPVSFLLEALDEEAT